MNASIWTPKITNDETRAVTNATKLMPCDPWLSTTSLRIDSEGLGALLVVADMVEYIVVRGT